MKKYVITNINGDTVYIRPYTIVSVLQQTDNLTIYNTDVEGVILSTLEQFEIGETIMGREIYSTVNYCRGMVLDK